MGWYELEGDEGLDIKKVEMDKDEWLGLVEWMDVIQEASYLQGRMASTSLLGFMLVLQRALTQAYLLGGVRLQIASIS